MEQRQSDDGRQKKMKKDVMLVIGAGQIGMAIARRVGFGKKIILGDKNIDNARTVAKIMRFLMFYDDVQNSPRIVIKAWMTGSEMPEAPASHWWVKKH